MKIHSLKFSGGLSQIFQGQEEIEFAGEEKYREIISFINELKQYANNIEKSGNNHFGALLEFNIFAFNNLNSLGVSDTTREKIEKRIIGIRTDLELRIRENSVRKKQSDIAALIQKILS